MKVPSTKNQRLLASQNHFRLTEKELRTFAPFISGMMESYDRLDQLSQRLSPHEKIKLTRGGYRPKQKENPFGAWAWKCSIKNSASQGKLSGKKIAVKDNVAVAGIPLTDGSPLLNGFIPMVDATIISRIIDAGGEIAGSPSVKTCAFPAALTLRIPRR